MEMKKRIGTKLGAVAIACICLLGVGCENEGLTAGTDIKTLNDIITVEHDNHLFIVLSDFRGYGGAGGLCHHPDCPCKNK
jgi:hypothetical protein